MRVSARWMALAFKTSVLSPWVMGPWQPHRVALKEKNQLMLLCGFLAALAPFRPMLDDPIRQRAFEADVSTGFFRFDPLVFQNLLAFRLKFPIKRRVFDQ